MRATIVLGLAFGAILANSYSFAQNGSSPADSIYQSARVKYQNNDFAGALQDCNALIKLNPNSDSAYANRGNVEASLEKYKEATADFAKAIQLDPTNADYYFREGMLHYILGENANSVNDYDRAIALGSRQL